MSELLHPITSDDIDKTGIDLLTGGTPKNSVWQMSRMRAVDLANNPEFQKLIGMEVARPLPTTSEEMEAVAVGAQAILDCANKLYPAIDSSDLSAAWGAVIDAYKKAGTPSLD
ncbi:hypothetical protein A2875_01875 [Candidatus Gottesmanbacteria bacterium RIFCSPHIGHO2_01_FULL_46_14]|uniref:Uncharacterized protein n=2 Tax=Candidatus Gottesmaniibacteriota TaxID=1752720 RepID=A0A1F5ZJF8_9BACT|nr:MAG: hypothetical protein A2875_01875 [Candidatus Gottesmanbacteria bacterium RIFCSPHIGHO2_01_FULL_46_14]OGG29866.1 MAG: hypothetical protein A2971_01405 [Candidatus Gottesmanbacteria bacterium RIFCSPLOWO2_01_FULL_46_21]